MSIPSPKLNEYGRPMRALRALEPGVPLREVDVYEAAKLPHSPDTSMWHDALRTLMRAGYVTRSGRRGGYRYQITDAGRRRLQDERGAS